MKQDIEPDNAALFALMREMAGKLDELILLKRFEHLGPEKILTFLSDDKYIQMYLPDGDVDYVQRKILLSRTFFEDTQLKRARKFIPENAVVYDLGANIGNHSVYFAAICGASKVMSFEAQTHCHTILEKNLELNGLTQATAHHCLLGTEGGSARLRNQAIKNLGATSFAPIAGQKGAFKMHAVDEFGLQEDRIDLVKIDVEGMQIPVLVGALKSLAKHKPTIWIELREKFNEVAETTGFLAQHGYKRTDTLGPHDIIF
jgi:FkbM family methyltransferase